VGRRGAQGAPEAAKAAAFCGWSENGCARRRAEHKGHVWTYDFVIDRIEDGGRLKLLAVVDEYTRECLYLDAERSVTAKEVVKTLSALFDQRGEPSFVRSDNGPEFVARVVKWRLEAPRVKTLNIGPGSPCESAYSETFIGRFVDQLLESEKFTSLLEARVIAEVCRRHATKRGHTAPLITELRLSLRCCAM